MINGSPPVVPETQLPSRELFRLRFESRVHNTRLTFAHLIYLVKLKMTVKSWPGLIRELMTLLKADKFFRFSSRFLPEPGPHLHYLGVDNASVQPPSGSWQRGLRGWAVVPLRVCVVMVVPRLFLGVFANEQQGLASHYLQTNIRSINTNTTYTAILVPHSLAPLRDNDSTSAPANTKCSDSIQTKAWAASGHLLFPTIRGIAECIQIKAPISTTDGGYTETVPPVLLTRDSNMVMPWTLPRLYLDTLPALDMGDQANYMWLKRHARDMRGLRSVPDPECGPDPNQFLATCLGIYGPKPMGKLPKVFYLCCESDIRTGILILLADVRLNLDSSTIALIPAWSQTKKLSE